MRVTEDQFEVKDVGSIIICFSGTIFVVWLILSILGKNTIWVLKLKYRNISIMINGKKIDDLCEERHKEGVCPMKGKGKENGSLNSQASFLGIRVFSFKSPSSRIHNGIDIMADAIFELR